MFRPYIQTGRPRVRKKASRLSVLAKQTGKSMYGTPDEWKQKSKECRKLAAYRCSKCKRDFRGRWSGLLHSHHKVPLSKGGKNAQSNLVALCRDCHEKTHEKMRKAKRFRR